MNYCFAYTKVEGRKGFYCSALNTEVCEGKACPFYKTHEQVCIEKKKTEERLSRLPKNEYDEIMIKYGKFIKKNRY